jgi:hypothetical protein
MRRPRISIARLMGVVSVIAVGAAALKVADEVWAGVMLALTIGLLGVAVLGALYGREARRAFWIGALLFGAAYLVPSLVEATREKLPTTRLLTYAHSKLAPSRNELALDNVSYALQGSGQVNGQVVLDFTTSPGQSGTVATTNGPTNSGMKFLFTVLSTGTTPEHFLTVGHCLLALVAGLIGGLIARAFYNGERARRPEAV